MLVFATLSALEPFEVLLDESALGLRFSALEVKSVGCYSHSLLVDVLVCELPPGSIVFD